MKKQVKRTMSAAVSCALVLGLLTGGMSVKAEKETVRILVPGLSEETTVDPVSGLETKSLKEFQDFLNEQIPDYNIEVKTIAWDGWIQSMEAMVTAGDVDIGFFTNQEAVPSWYMDLTPYLESDPDLNLENMSEWFIDPAVYYSTYKSFNHPEDSGKIFGIPVTIACNMIVYDSQLFQEWGVEEPAADVTFSELVDLAEQMTGTNPVTGRTNYGGHLFSTWTEWYSLCYSAVKPYMSDTMDINDLDMEEYVEYIKDSEEVKGFFSDLIRLVDCCNPAVATGSGAENWMTEDNDIAINFDTNNHTSTYMKYVYAGDESITDRYKPILIPAGEYGEGFPEFFRFAVAKNAKNPDAAWEVIKAFATSKDCVNFYLTNYAADKVTCLRDIEGIEMMEYAVNQERHEYQLNNMFITDDYWYWRTAMQSVVNQILSKQYTADQAVEAFYEEVSSWVNNIKQQSAN